MPQHLHVYTGTGRCIRSVPLRGDMSRTHAGAPVPVLSTLLDLGFVATMWATDEHACEAAGLAACKGETYIVRIKGDAMQRDMRGGGAAAAIADIQRHGVDITAEDAWLFPR